jgi:DNA-cytosine methyltransferase
VGVQSKTDYISLFSGIGGLDLAAQHFLGWRARCYVEWDPHCQRCLVQRFRDGALNDAPIWDDARTFDARPFGGVFALTAGFPCQPFSQAGKQRGADDPRNAWPATARAVEQCRPRVVLLENVPRLLSPRRSKGRVQAPSYFGRVLSDLAALGYDATWGCVSSADAGAPHGRQRLWILAYADRGGLALLREAHDHYRADARRDHDNGRDPLLAYPPAPGATDERWRGWLGKGGALPGIRRGAARPPEWKQRLIAAGNAVAPSVAFHAVGSLLSAALATTPIA